MKNNIFKKIIKEHALFIAQTAKAREDVYKQLPLLSKEEENILISGILSELKVFVEFVKIQYAEESNIEIQEIHTFNFDFEPLDNQDSISWTTVCHKKGACFHEPYEIRISEITGFNVEDWEDLVLWKQLSLALVISKAIDVFVQENAFLTLPLHKKVNFVIGDESFTKKVYTHTLQE